MSAPVRLISAALASEVDFELASQEAQSDRCSSLLPRGMRK